MMLSSNPVNRLWYFPTICGSNVPFRSLGTSIGTVPNVPLIVFADLPLREFPLPSPATSCFSYPTCSVISAVIARSSNCFVNCFSEAVARIERADYDFNLKIVVAPNADNRIAEERRTQIIASSRAQYATDRQQVEDCMFAFRPSTKAPVSKTVEVIVDETVSMATDEEKVSAVVAEATGRPEHRVLQELIK